jgi:hypothetical protein
MKLDIMERHGTEGAGLTVGAVLQAVKADIQRRTRNKDGERHSGEYEHYAFHRKHVVKAKGTVATLLRLAADERHIGLASGKKWTRLIYQDEALLREAANAKV